MALFNVTSLDNVSSDEFLFNFKTSNVNINIDTIDLKISEIRITEQEWLGN